MDEYIARKEILKDLELLAKYQYGERQQGILAVCETIKRKPAADVVEVVRCQKCKYRKEDKDYARGHYCVKRPSNGGYFCEDNDFCSYGKRRVE